VETRTSRQVLGGAHGTGVSLIEHLHRVLWRARSARWLAGSGDDRPSVARTARVRLRRPPDGTVLTAALAAAIIIAAAAWLSDPEWPRAAHNAALGAALKTLAGLAVLLACWIALLRAEETRLAADLALALGVLFVLLTSVLLALVGPVGLVTSSSVVDWLPVPGRLAGAALLVWAGRRNSRVLGRIPNRHVLILMVVACVIVLAIGGGALGSSIHAPGARVGLQITTVALYLVAAATLLQRARRSGDAVLYWFAAASVALAFSRLLFTLSTAFGAASVSPGDLARLATGALLLGAVQTEFATRRTRGRARAIEEERRRYAREIHDGLAQELAFIVSQSHRLMARAPDNEGLKLVADAAQSALADARCTIFKMSHPGASAPTTTLVERTFQVAERVGLALDVEVHGRLEADPELEHELLRIITEAVSNAGRHAHATRVSIRITAEDSKVVVRIADDGDGFDPRSLPRRRGFGLSSMTQRAELLGGRFSLESQPGSGTVIEVAI